MIYLDRKFIPESTVTEISVLMSSWVANWILSLHNVQIEVRTSWRLSWLISIFHVAVSQTEMKLYFSMFNKEDSCREKCDLRIVCNGWAQTGMPNNLFSMCLNVEGESWSGARVLIL